jgi:hypothetical protein
MENTPRLYDTMVGVLSQHEKWADVRHLKTLAWMVVGLILSGEIHLSEWVVYVSGRAQYAASSVRRMMRWLDNPRVAARTLYAPLIREALHAWEEHTLYLALDTSMLWNRYCLIRLSVIYRGRAVPLIWQVIEHASSSVAFEVYRPLLDEAARCLPAGATVVFLADRGFADTALMAYLSAELKWHWRIRIKNSFWVHRPGRAACKVGRLTLPRGVAHFAHAVAITNKHYGPVHLAVARPLGSQERWVVLSDQPTSLRTLEEYGRRFAIEEGFLDDKSNGFQLEASGVTGALPLERLCLVLAVATLYLVSQGTHIVEQKLRRWVDPHWFRGHSYLKLGWKWVKRALSLGWDLTQVLRLSSAPDPEPCCPSLSQQPQPPRFVSVLSTDYAAA